jgi:hypothetical protein
MHVTYQVFKVSHLKEVGYSGATDAERSWKYVHKHFASWMKYMFNILFVNQSNGFEFSIYDFALIHW